MGENVGGNLAELRRHVDIGQTEDDRAVGILDFTRSLAELYLRIGGLPGLGETTFDQHCPVSFVLQCARHRRKCPRLTAEAFRSQSQLPSLKGNPYLGDPVSCEIG
ncbi:hypothetical protein D3C87_1715810 [compost metagenome]